MNKSKVKKNKKCSIFLIITKRNIKKTYIRKTDIRKNNIRKVYISEIDKQSKKAKNTNYQIIKKTNNIKKQKKGLTMTYSSLVGRIKNMNLLGEGVVNITSLLVSCLYDGEITLIEFTTLLKQLTETIEQKQKGQ